MSEPILADAAAARLAALPRFEPPDALWPRIVAARRRARLRLAAYAAAAALAAVAVLAAVRTIPTTAPAHLDAQLVETRALEDALAAARTRRPPNSAVRALERELAAVDAALQGAYDRAAPEHERAALWQARARRLDALLVAYRHADTLVRL